MDYSFSQFLDLEKIDSLYKSITLIEREDLHERSRDMFLGAELALMAVLGVDNELTKKLGISMAEENREAMIEAAKASMIRNNPGCTDVSGNPLGLEEMEEAVLIEEPKP
jgi:hypothetical protein